MTMPRLATIALILVLGPGAAGPAAQSGPVVRFGVVTDVHYADIDPSGARTYRESPAKLAECVRVMNERQAEFVVELGDFKDQDKTPDPARTRQYLERIESVLAGFHGPRYHVLGNHDVDSLSKQEFLGRVVNTGVVPNATRYTFVRRGIRFVVLDANHKSDGTDYDRGNYEWADSNIDAAQLQWLRATLASSREPVVVMVHQQLDGTGAYYVKNAADVRAVLERAGNVIAVLQGHRHEGGFSGINGIPYFTFRGLVEGSGLPNSACSVVDVLPDHSLWVTGFLRAESRGFQAVR